MAVRKRNWTTPGGEAKTAWIVDYPDGSGKRRQKTFEKKRDADAFAATAKVEIRTGVHVPDSASITVEQAGRAWLEACEANGLEPTSIAQYRQHLDLHIVPLIGQVLLSRLSVPIARAFEDDLRRGGRSAVMVRKVRGSLGALLSDAQERGQSARNAVREMSKARRPGKERQHERRHNRKLKIGVDIPSRDEIRLFIGKLEGRWRPLFLTAVFTGLRASELRGLKWVDIDLDAKTIDVRQRADAANKIGSPKSEAGERQVTIPPLVVNALKEWKLACPKGKLGLVFPNGNGNVEAHANIVNRGLMPTMVAAGVGLPTGKTDKDGKPVLKAKYTGMHALRHFYASWCINPAALGGQGLSPKEVQERLGHSSIVMTMDTYGHLFPSTDEGSRVASAAEALLR